MDEHPELSDGQRRVFAAGLLVLGALLGWLALRRPWPLGLAFALTLGACLASMVLRPALWRSHLASLAFPGCLGVITALAFTAPVPAAVLVAGALTLLAVAAWRIPSFGRALYDRWLLAAEPMGWVLTGLVLAVMYFLVITPIGLLLRLTGHDPLRRRREPAADSYWTALEPDAGPEQYFRQS